jgi:predicted NBD/HSP70 family sugar kinase
MPLPGFGDPLGDQPREASPEFQTLVSGDSVVELGARYGLQGDDADTVLEAALADPSGGKAFLDELAARLATGAAMIVSVLDPELVVLAGPTSRAGGETLRSLIEERLHELTPLRPALALSAVPGNAVLAGAVEIGLHALRDALFTPSA